MKNKIIDTMAALRADEIVDFNLGDLTIDGRRVFKLGEFKRSAMPQLRGFPMKNSVAEQMPVDKKGKIDVSYAFLAWLKRKHKMQVVRGTHYANELQGAQCELVASKVAGKLPKMLDDPKHKKFEQLYIVAADKTLLDGHHGWAAIRLVELLTDTKRLMQTYQVMCHIDQLVELATQFTETVGVATKEGL